eukprot:4518475-Amphidinium_carterae.1
MASTALQRSVTDWSDSHVLSLAQNRSFGFGNLLRGTTGWDSRMSFQGMLPRMQWGWPLKRAFLTLLDNEDVLEPCQAVTSIDSPYQMPVIGSAFGLHGKQLWTIGARAEREDNSCHLH